VKTDSIVTGSTVGIGFAIANALAAEGARVIVNGRSGTHVTEAIAFIRAEVYSSELEAIALILSNVDRVARQALSERASRNLRGAGAHRGCASGL
jgi:NAD(P)-dependent dehydrogenase (short-subunit alcohol dehydrogenase family)